jgi:hypothetical protein
MDEKKSGFGVRLSLENFSAFEKVKVLPLYAVSSIHSLKKILLNYQQISGAQFGV